MVIQLVRVSIKPDQRDKWLEMMPENVAQTRSEDGCESCQVTEDVEAPNTFVLLERWRDLDANFEHFRSPKFGELMGSLGQILAGPPEVSINEIASTFTLDEALAAAGVGRLRRDPSGPNVAEPTPEGGASDVRAGGAPGRSRSTLVPLPLGKARGDVR